VSQLDELPNRFDGYNSALLLAPLDTDVESRGCLDLLTRAAPAGTNVLSVTFSATPFERVALWKRNVGEELPKRVAIVGTECGRLEQEDAIKTDGRLVIEGSLSEPVDPFGLLLTVGRYLGEWAETDERTLVCIRSLTALLDTMQIWQLQHLIGVLNAHFQELGTAAHYHLDPGAHDEQVLADLRPLFDTVIQFDDELGWTISQPEAREPLRPDDATGSERSPHSAIAESAQSDDPLVPHSFDTVVDVLSSPQRRALLYYLVIEREGAPTVSLETLVEELHRLATSIGEESWDTSEQALQVSLLHVHLPRLAEMGLIEFDLEAKTVQYQPNPALESVLKQVMEMEGTA
jgi:hypothetical protein